MLKTASAYILLPVSVPNGGTGRTSLPSGYVLIGNGSGPINSVAPGNVGNVLTSNGTTWVSQALSTGNISGLGTMALQNANSVNITGGTATLTNLTANLVSTSNVVITSLTGYLYGNGGSNVTASTSIPAGNVSGLGTMAFQNANSVAITGGTIDGTAIGNTTPAQGNFTATRINQSWDEGVGRLHVAGQTTVEGTAVARLGVLQGGNNLFRWSEDFSNAVWTLTSAAVTTNQIVAPDGNTTADLLQANAGTGTTPRITDVSLTTILSFPYTISIYVRANTYTFIQIYVNNQAGEWANFTLSGAGTASANGASTATITNVGNSWYRLTFTYTAGGTDRRPFIMLAASGAATRGQTWNPVGTESVYIWGAQLELGTVASPYTPTTSAAVTTTNDIQVPSGQILTALGTASAPTHGFLGNTNTGMFSPAANTVAASTNGTERLRINSSGELIIGNGDTAASPSNGVLRGTNGSGTDITGATLTIQGGRGTGTGAGGPIVFNTAAAGGATGSGLNAATERMRITSDGQLLINTSSARTNVLSGAIPQLQVEGSSVSTTIISIIRSSANSGGPRFLFAKSRGATVGTNAIVQNGDSIGQILFEGNDGTNFIDGAYILSVIDGIPGSGDMPAALTFGTTLDGTATPIERLRINNAGAIIIGNGETAASPANALLQATGGSGSNITGATLTIQGGRGTGTGAGGPIVFSTSAAGSSGSSLNAATERMRIISSGEVGIGTSSPTALLDVNSNTIRLRTARTPASATAAGNAGDICWDADYIYVAVALNTWKRAALSTW